MTARVGMLGGSGGLFAPILEGERLQLDADVPDT